MPPKPVYALPDVPLATDNLTCFRIQLIFFHRLSKISISLKDSGDCSNIGDIQLKAHSLIKAILKQNKIASYLDYFYSLNFRDTTQDNSLVINFNVCQISFTLNFTPIKICGKNEYNNHLYTGSTLIASDSLVELTKKLFQKQRKIFWFLMIKPVNTWPFWFRTRFSTTLCWTWKKVGRPKLGVISREITLHIGIG